jgi:transcriptional regulator with XRE-family HTH domain
MRAMATRDEPVHRGAEKGRAAWTRFRYEVREARLSLGKSQAACAREAGIDQAVWSRLESDRRQAADLETLGRMAGVVGLDLALTLYPAPRVLRDHGSILLHEDTKLLLGPAWDWRHEVRAAGAPDLRAWDLAGSHRVTRLPIRTECELVFRDCQATLRRIELKASADGKPRVVLSIRASRANKRAVDLAMPMLRTAFPLSGRDALPALRRGEDPGANVLLLVDWQRRTPSGLLLPE